MKRNICPELYLLKKCRYFLFDYDGTIVDSEVVHRLAFDLLFDKLNLKYEFCEIAGLDTYSAIDLVLQRNKKVSVSSEICRLVKMKRVYAAKFFFRIRLKPGVSDFLKKFVLGRSFAICSGASEETIRKGLKHFCLSEYFDVLFGVESVRSSKPSPEVYKKAIDFFGCSPSDCLVFEDTDVGKIAGLDAGCHVIDVRSTSFLKLQAKTECCGTDIS